MTLTTTRVRKKERLCNTSSQIVYVLFCQNNKLRNYNRENEIKNSSRKRERRERSEINNRFD